MTNAKRTGRCICGIKLAYHWSPDNRFLSCPQAQAAHPRAKVTVRSLRMLLCSSGAVAERTSVMVTGIRIGNVVGTIAPRGTL